MDLIEVPLLSMKSDVDLPPAQTPSCHSFKLILLFVTLLSGFSILHFARFSIPSTEEVRRPNDTELTRLMEMSPTTPLPVLKQLTSHPKLTVQFLQDFYASQAPERTKQLDTTQEGSGFATLYNVLVPEAYCPDIVRVGIVTDGGKWVCNPLALPKTNCSIYSFGLSDAVSFDQQIQSFNDRGCRLFGYDIAVQSDKTKAAYAAINGRTMVVRISARTSSETNEYTLEDLMQDNGESDWVEMVKMDIESAEHTALPPFLDRYRTCQIFLEIHGSSFEHLSLLRQISSRGYWLFSYEINGADTRACEYSFIHSECIEKYGAVRLAQYLKRGDAEKENRPI